MPIRRPLSLVALATLLVTVTSPVFAQSFDCSKAHAADEQAVCRSASLSALDDRMDDLYEAILKCALMGTRAAVTESQRSFLTRRAACGADEGCLTALYSARVDDLAGIRRDVGQGAC